MLRTLELSNFAIIDQLRLELGDGLNVLTGETGAGKSILVDALALLIGNRADSSLVRTGADSALIQGMFDGSEGIESAARRLGAGGRSSARLDGELVNIGELSQIGKQLIAIHGQHAFATLMDASEQRKLLDRLLDNKARAILAQYRKDYAAYGRVTGELEFLRGASRERAQRLDMLSFQRDEIDAARLDAGEEAALASLAQSLRHAERIVQGAGRALDLLSEADVSAAQLLAEALRELEAAGRYQGELETLAHDLSETLTGVQAIAQEVDGFLSDFEAEPSRLEEVEARLALLDKLKRKYGDSVAAVLHYRKEIEAELDRLEHAETDVGTLEQEQAQLHQALREAAAKLSEARQQAAQQLSRGVTAHIRPLGMNNANFNVELSPLSDLGAHGQDNICFLFSANLGEPAAPLSTVASGGELSRVMLGLNVATGSDLPTLVFDEVDAGIGGQTAREVGALLKRLAADHQVLVVTHLAQVAAFADQQFFVEKVETEGRTVTRVRELGPKEREAELARMLSGAVTDKALAHARELLQEVQAVSLSR